MSEPLFRQIKLDLKTVLEKVKDNTSSTIPAPPLFKHVYSEHPLARDLAASKLPAATIWGEDIAYEGHPSRSLTASIDTSIYVYFHCADASEADKKLDYYRRDIIAEIEAHCDSWPILTTVRVSGASNTDIFKLLGLTDLVLKPPFYGLRIDLAVKMETTRI